MSLILISFMKLSFIDFTCSLYSSRNFSILFTYF